VVFLLPSACFCFSSLSRFFSVFLPPVLFFFPSLCRLFPPFVLSLFPLSSLPSLSRCRFFSPLLLSVVQCWCGCDGEWQWLLDEEDDELTMALAMLVRLSPLLFFSSVVPLWFSLSFPLFFFFSSLLFSSGHLCFPPLHSSLSLSFFPSLFCPSFLLFYSQNCMRFL